MKRWLTSLIGGLSIALVAFVPSTQLGAGVSSPSTSPAVDVDGLRSRVAAILERTGVPGAGIAIATVDGMVWTGGVGLADVEQQRPVTAATVFRLGSVTKNVTALAVMQQVEQGRLSLDARLRDVAPEVLFGNAWEETHPVRISNLLEHTAGFDFIRFNDDVDYGPGTRSIVSALEVNPRTRDTRWPPGTRMAYSNEGFTAAGYVLEKVTNRTFDEVAHDEIFARVGMPNSAMKYTPGVADLLATGYTSAGRAEVYVEDMQRPAANMMASAEDMGHYLLMLLRRGALEDGSHLISTEGLTRMEQRVTLPYAGPEEQYGLGTDTAQYPGGFVAHGHVGITLGFKASLRYFPQQGVGWVVLLNAQPSDQALNEIEAELLAFITRESPPRLPSPGSYAHLADLVGYYRDAAPVEEISAAVTGLTSGLEIQQRDDGLWEGLHQPGLRSLVSGPFWRRLVPVGTEGGFRHEDEVIASRYFAVNGEGAQVVVTPMGYFERSPAWLNAAQRLVLVASAAILASPLLLVSLALAQAMDLPLLSMLTVLGAPAPGWTVIGPITLLGISAAAYAVLSSSTQRLSEVNLTTIGVFVLSSALPLLALVSAGGAIRAAVTADVGLFYRSHLMLIGAAAAVLTVFAWRAHWVALRTWAW